GFFEFDSKLAAPIKPVHACKVKVKLINGSLFNYRYTLPYNFRHYPGMIAVTVHITLQVDRRRTEPSCQLQRHRTMHTEFSCLIAARSHHPPVGTATDDNRLAFQGIVLQPCHTHKKCIQVKMRHIP